MNYLRLCFLISLIFCSCENKEIKPNIIVFIADDVSWDDIGIYGNSQVSTPNIDELGSNGLVFHNAYLTTSSCSPSRNSIITGRYPHNTGAPELHSQPPMDMKTFIFELKESGYFTVSSGKFHMGDYARKSFDIIHEGRKDNGLGGEAKWVSSIEKRPKDFMIISGDDETAVKTVLLGGDGVISVAAGCIPKYFTEIIRLALNKNEDLSQKKLNQIQLLLKLLFAEGNPSGIKSALSSMNLCKNVLRLPLTKVGKDLDLNIKKTITSIYKQQ